MVLCFIQALIMIVVIVLVVGVVVVGQRFTLTIHAVETLQKPVILAKKPLGTPETVRSILMMRGLN